MTYRPAESAVTIDRTAGDDTATLPSTRASTAPTLSGSPEGGLRASVFSAASALSNWSSICVAAPFTSTSNCASIWSCSRCSVARWSSHTSAPPEASRISAKASPIAVRSETVVGPKRRKEVAAKVRDGPAGAMPPLDPIVAVKASARQAAARTASRIVLSTSAGCQGLAT